MHEREEPGPTVTGGSPRKDRSLPQLKKTSTSSSNCSQTTIDQKYFWPNLFINIQMRFASPDKVAEPCKWLFEAFLILFYHYCHSWYPLINNTPSARCSTTHRYFSEMGCWRTRRGTATILQWHSSYAMLNTLFVTHRLIGWFDMTGSETVGFYAFGQPFEQTNRSTWLDNWWLYILDD